MTTDLDLAKFGVRELDAKEMAEIDGGWLPIAVAAAVGVALLLWPKDAH